MSMYEDLDKLHKLKENGVITEEEYELEKKRLLEGRNSKEQNQNIGMILIRIIVFILGFILMYWSMRNWWSYNYYINNSSCMFNHRKSKEIKLNIL